MFDRFPRRSMTLAATALAVVLVASACSTADDASTGSTPAATPSAPTATASPGATPSPGEAVPSATPDLPDVPVGDASLENLAATPALPAPDRITVEALGIDMPIDAMGVDENNEMALPEDANRSGWYRFGPTPASDTGATLIAAHVDSYQTGIGQFAKLLDVRTGTSVTVTTDDGETHRYTITDVERVPKDQVVTAEMFDRTGDPRLLLVTCGGTFQRNVGHYTDNVIVTALPEGR